MTGKSNLLTSGHVVSTSKKGISSKRKDCAAGRRFLKMNVEQALRKFEHILEKIEPDDLIPFLHRAQTRIKGLCKKQKTGFDDDWNKTGLGPCCRFLTSPPPPLTNLRIKKCMAASQPAVATFLKQCTNLHNCLVNW